MRKPTPPVLPRISRTIEDIRASIYAHIDAVQDEFAARGWLPRRLNLNKGVLRGLIELVAWCVWQIYNLLEKLLRQAIPHLSEDEWLDLHLESVGEKRKDETKALGMVFFIRKPGVLGNIVIPPGRIVRTKPDGNGAVYRFVSLENTVLPADADRVGVLVESEEYGAKTNAAPGQICELATPVTGIGDVVNAADWLISEGADRESNASAHKRYTLKWKANNGCTKHAYELWALSVPGVISVEILDKHPRGQGTVGIVVRGSAGLPTARLLERVREAIKGHTPINDEWYVTAPVPVYIAIAGCLHYVTGDPDRLTREAELRVLALFADESPYDGIIPLVIGQDVPLDLLTATAMSAPHAKSVDWFSPAADVIVPKDGMAVLESVKFTSIAEKEA